jgi:hypothetical protein
MKRPCSITTRLLLLSSNHAYTDTHTHTGAATLLRFTHLEHERVRDTTSKRNNRSSASRHTRFTLSPLRKLVTPSSPPFPEIHARASKPLSGRLDRNPKKTRPAAVWVYEVGTTEFDLWRKSTSGRARACVRACVRVCSKQHRGGYGGPRAIGGRPTAAKTAETCSGRRSRHVRDRRRGESSAKGGESDSCKEALLAR